MKTKICIPTYKRKDILAFELIKNNAEVIFDLCVRKEEFESGFYDEPQFKLPNIRFTLLQDVHDIGDTRQRILEIAEDEGYKYCMMLDDTVSKLKHNSDRMKDIIEQVEDRFETDPLADRAVAFIFGRKLGRKDVKYFGGQLMTGYVFNVQNCMKYDLRFHRTTFCGIEDLDFFIQMLMKSCIMLSDNSYVVKSLKPCSFKSGGTHDGTNPQDDANKYNAKFQLLDAWIKTVYDSKGIFSVYRSNFVESADGTNRFILRLDQDMARLMLIEEPQLFAEYARCQFKKSKIERLDKELRKRCSEKIKTIK